MLDFIWLATKLFGEKVSEANTQEQIKNKYRNISKMEIWDGVKKQITDHYSFYHYDINEKWRKVGVYWKGDKNRWFETSLVEVEINMNYRNSGLNMEDYFKSYYHDLFNKHKNDGAFWSYGSLTEPYWNMKIYSDYNDYVHLIGSDISHSFSIYDKGKTITISAR